MHPTRIPRPYPTRGGAPLSLPSVVVGAPLSLPSVVVGAPMSLSSVVVGVSDSSGAPAHVIPFRAGLVSM